MRSTMNRLNLQERREKNRDRIHNSKSATAKKKLNRLNLQERRERNRDRIRNSKSATAKKKLVSAIAICVSRGLFTKVDQTIVKVAIPRYNKIFRNIFKWKSSGPNFNTFIF